jgi:hypothetical protein
MKRPGFTHGNVNLTPLGYWGIRFPAFNIKRNNKYPNFRSIQVSI